MSKIVIVLNLIFILSCAGFSNLSPIVREQIHMGTKVRISGLTHLKDSEKAFKAINKVDKTLSTYLVDSPIVELNNGQTVVLTNSLKKYLEASAQMQVKTNYLFDPSLGGFTTSFKTHKNYTPGFKTLSLSQLLQGSQAKYIKLPEGVKLDFGGIGKGIALWEASSVLKNNKENFMIKISGDIYCNKPCEIVIEKPYESSKSFKFKTCKEKMTISTSGNYRNFIKNRKNNHLLDPKSKKSQQTTASVTVVTTEEPYVADALATALAVAKDKKQRQKLISQFKASYIHVSNKKEYEFGQSQEEYFCDLDYS